MTGHGDPGPDAGPVDVLDLGDGHQLCWVLFASKPAAPWIVTLDPAEASRPNGCACARCCAHEQPGGLPVLFRARLAAAWPDDHDDDPGGAT